MSDIQQNSIKAWVLAARPKTLSGAVMPVLIGGALALRQTGADFNVTPFVLCVLFFGIVPVVFTYWCIVGVAYAAARNILVFGILASAVVYMY